MEPPLLIPRPYRGGEPRSSEQASNGSSSDSLRARTGRVGEHHLESSLEQHRPYPSSMEGRLSCAAVSTESCRSNIRSSEVIELERASYDTRYHPKVELLEGEKYFDFNAIDHTQTLMFIFNQVVNGAQKKKLNQILEHYFGDERPKDALIILERIVSIYRDFKNLTEQKNPEALHLFFEQMQGMMQTGGDLHLFLIQHTKSDFSVFLKLCLSEMFLTSISQVYEGHCKELFEVVFLPRKNDFDVNDFYHNLSRKFHQYKRYERQFSSLRTPLRKDLPFYAQANKTLKQFQFLKNIAMVRFLFDSEARFLNGRQEYNLFQLKTVFEKLESVKGIKLPQDYSKREHFLFKTKCDAVYYGLKGLLLLFGGMGETDYVQAKNLLEISRMLDRNLFSEKDNEIIGKKLLNWSLPGIRELDPFAASSSAGPWYSAHPGAEGSHYL